MRKVKDAIEWLKVYGIAAVLIAAAFYVAFQFVGPAPTKNIAIATGGKSGAYYGFGQQYAQRFKQDGVELSVLETEGSIDNLTRLANEDGKVWAALIQGGVGTPEAYPQLESLGSLYHEPLWLFHTKDISVDTLGDLAGRRIALGSPASGTHALTVQLLDQNEVTGQSARFLEIGGQTAVDALLSGEADALFVVAGTQSEMIADLLTHPQVVVHSFKRAEAYVRNFKYLSRVVLPQGSFDLHRNIPDRDITLVAPGANMVVHQDLHPALIYLFMIAAEEAHHEGGLLERRGAFPSPQGVGFPLNKVARRYYQSGPPFLLRVLPFWLATWLVRMFILIIPLITILYPLMKIAPPTYTWRIRRKVFKLYKRLYRVEMEAAEAPEPEVVDGLLQHLETLESKAAELDVPASYMASQYHLRRNIDWIRSRLESIRQALQGK